MRCVNQYYSCKQIFQGMIWTSREKEVSRDAKAEGVPEVSGTLQLDYDAYGRFVSCLQCGYTKDLPNPAEETGKAAATAPKLRKQDRRAA